MMRDMLPIMQGGIMLQYGEKILIIDAEYYSYIIQVQYSFEVRPCLIFSSIYNIGEFEYIYSISPFLLLLLFQNGVFCCFEEDYFLFANTSYCLKKKFCNCYT